MRRLVFVILVSSLLMSIAFVQKGSIPAVEADLPIYQGDLVLNGNNVTTIEGRFDINGSIIVEENATLILRNAILNFTQVKNYQFNMTFRNPSSGNPRLIVENATITSNNYYQQISFFGNGSAFIDKLTSTYTALFVEDSSVVSISNSTMFDIRPRDYSVVSMSNSTLSGLLIAEGHSSLSVFNCTLDYLSVRDMSNVDLSNSSIFEIDPVGSSVNCSVTGLEPCFVDYWNFQQNCSVVIAPSGSAPNLTLTETQVWHWSFEFEGSSNTTIHDSELRFIYTYDFVVVWVYDSTFSGGLSGRSSSEMHAYNLTTDFLDLHQSSRVWLVNSTSKTNSVHDLSEVYICWYLDVHVIDSEDTDVPSANVTATPSLPLVFPNVTTGDSQLTNVNGWVKLTLMEKMMNATAEYSVGNYTVTAKYETHQGQQSVNMTENKQTTIQLPFIIPEFPTTLILLILLITTTYAIYITHLKKQKHTP